MGPNALPNGLNEKNGPLAQETLEDLVLEYNSLFMAPGPRYVPPYESVYTDAIEIEYGPFQGGAAQEPVREASALLWGESTVAVQRTYAAAGLEVASVGEPPDHLGLELEFMALLCQREAEAWQAKAVERARKQLETEQDFLEAHLLHWLPLFRAKLEANATRPFYRVMAGLAQRFLEVDRGHVEAALEKTNSAMTMDGSACPKCQI
ncbi:MAG: molecular chaperone TorD family protein [Chloroflexi bacterium]|nr:molecular chaperone TorD family protein [Chloroflexota bacterium]